MRQEFMFSWIFGIWYISWLTKWNTNFLINMNCGSDNILYRLYTLYTLLIVIDASSGMLGVIMGYRSWKTDQNPDTKSMKSKKLDHHKSCMLANLLVHTLTVCSGPFYVCIFSSSVLSCWSIPELSIRTCKAGSRAVVYSFYSRFSNS